MMIKCARRCCICRRFRPTKLQVHHIVEKGQGGTNDEDNLIVICLPCHTDVHSQVPFTRRFSPEELKGHRDTLIRMVAEGKFPAEEPDNTDQLIARVVSGRGVGTRADAQEALSPEAVEILLGAAHATGNRQGMIVLSKTNYGLRIFPGNQQCPYNVADRRATAKYKAALEELLSEDLIEYASDSLREVTHAGYLLADEIASAHGQSSEPT